MKHLLQRLYGADAPEYIIRVFTVRLICHKKADRLVDRRSSSQPRFALESISARRAAPFVSICHYGLQAPTTYTASTPKNVIAQLAFEMATQQHVHLRCLQNRNAGE